MSRVTAHSAASGAGMSRLTALSAAPGAGIGRLTALSAASGAGMSRVTAHSAAPGAGISRLTAHSAASGAGMSRLTAHSARSVTAWDSLAGPGQTVGIEFGRPAEDWCRSPKASERVATTCWALTAFAAHSPVTCWALTGPCGRSASPSWNVDTDFRRTGVACRQSTPCFGTLIPAGHGVSGVSWRSSLTWRHLYASSRTIARTRRVRVLHQPTRARVHCAPLRDSEGRSFT